MGNHFPWTAWFWPRLQPYADWLRSWTFTPATNYNGPVSFTYNVTDGTAVASTRRDVNYHGGQ